MASPNGIRAVLFDLDGTLRHNRPSAQLTFFQFASESGFSSSPEQQRQALRWAHSYWADSEELRTDLQKHPDDENGFWLLYAEKHLRAAGCPPDLAAANAAEVHERMRLEYQPEDWVPPEVPETLRQLRERGYTVGVVSNRDDPLGPLLEALQIAPLVQFSLAAGEVSSWKPKPGIFQRALDLAGSQAHETIYVGDNYFADIVGARGVGIYPVLLDPEGVFPEANCRVIEAVRDIITLLDAPQPRPL